jgi:hypothetical protein
MKEKHTNKGMNADKIESKCLERKELVIDMVILLLYTFFTSLPSGLACSRPKPQEPCEQSDS